MIAFVYKNTLLFTLHLSVFVMNSLLCFDMFPEKNYLFCFFFESVLLYFLIYFYLLLFFLMSFILKLIQIDLRLRSRRPLWCRQPWCASRTPWWPPGKVMDIQKLLLSSISLSATSVSSGQQSFDEALKKMWFSTKLQRFWQNCKNFLIKLSCFDESIFCKFLRVPLQKLKRRTKCFAAKIKEWEWEVNFSPTSSVKYTLGVCACVCAREREYVLAWSPERDRILLPLKCWLRAMKERKRALSSWPECGTHHLCSFDDE